MVALFFIAIYKGGSGTVNGTKRENSRDTYDIKKTI